MEVIPAVPSVESILFTSPQIIEVLTGRDPTQEVMLRGEYEPRKTLKTLLGNTLLEDAILRLGEEEHGLASQHDMARRLYRFLGVRSDVETILTVRLDTLRQLREREAAATLRRLLWAEVGRLGLPTTSVTLSLDTKTADGGVDASLQIEGSVPAGSLLNSGLTCFQVKAGSSFVPWRQSSIERELWSKREKSAAGLGSELRRCLEGGGRYVLVSFGHDLLTQQRNKSRDLLRNCFSKCGFPGAVVDVWGVGQLLGALQRFPSLRLQLSGRSELEFLTFETWAGSSNMSPPWRPGSDQIALIQQIRGALRREEPLLVCVTGEPGVGKTRLVLEALRDPDLAAQVVYCAQAEEFRESQLLREILRPDSDFHAVLVLDECSSRDRAEIWDYLRPIRARISMITLSHEPDRSRDDAMIHVVVPSLPDEQVKAILTSYRGAADSSDVDRWVPLCEGSPRVAHVIGRNLQLNPEEILAPPSTNNVWSRFVVGADDADSNRVAKRWAVLRHASLFRRFGYRGPVAGEGQAVSAMAQAANHMITEAGFHEVVTELRERRILQGRTTLRIVPKALHVWLWLQWWNTYGPGFRYSEFVQRLSGELPRWFAEMFVYAGSSKQARSAAESLLGPGGALDADSIRMEAGARFYRAIAEACPEAALTFLERTLESWSDERIASFSAGRRHVVWALEGIVVWGPLFARGALLLLRLAEHENERCVNNATGLFASLFSPAPGRVSMTEAPPSDRLRVLRDTLLDGSRSVRARQICLQACRAALKTHGFTRMLGSEHQGLRPEPELWWPATYGEYADAYRGVWRLLLEFWENSESDLRQEAANVLLDRGSGLLTRFGGLMAEEVVEGLQALADDPLNQRSLISRILRILDRKEERLPSGVADRLRAIHDGLVGDSVQDRIRRYVGMNLQEDRFLAGLGYRDAEEKIRTTLRELAQACLDHPETLEEFLPWLVSRVPERPVQFGQAVAGLPGGLDWLPRVIEAQDAAGPEGALGFLAGFLRAVREGGEDLWEERLDELASRSTQKGWVGELTWRSGALTEKAANRVCSLAREGAFPVAEFGFWRWGGDLAQLPSAVFLRWISLLLDTDVDGSDPLALDLTASFLHHEQGEGLRELPVPVVESILHRTFSLSEPPGDSMLDHSWAEVARVLLETVPDRGLALLTFCLSRFSEGEQRPSRSSRGEILRGIFRRTPSEAWGIVSPHLEDVWSIGSYEIMNWLRGDMVAFAEDVGQGYLGYVPREVLWDWIEAHVDERAQFIARYVPKTLEPDGGDLARELLTRYGDREDVQRELLANFGSTSWSGSAAEHFRRARLKAEEWRQGEGSPRVTKWIDQYLERLNWDIERSEISEERGR